MSPKAPVIIFDLALSGASAGGEIWVFYRVLKRILGLSRNTFQLASGPPTANGGCTVKP